jgi:hypothetical protein
MILVGTQTDRNPTLAIALRSRGSCHLPENDRGSMGIATTVQVFAARRANGV